jgi:hypothetical protein
MSQNYGSESMDITVTGLRSRYALEAHMNSGGGQVKTKVWQRVDRA